MRVCPDCRKLYADDVEACPDDGSALMEAHDRPVNPELRDVVPVSPTDHTAMIDLEAIEAERERRGLNKPAPTAEVDAIAATGEEEPEEPEEPRDPDATGTFHVDDLKRGPDRTQVNAAGSSVADGDEGDEEETRERPYRTAERTERTRLPRDDEDGARRERRGAAGEAGSRKRGIVLAASIAGALVVSLGLAGGVWFYVSSRGAVLTVTSVPPGASVFLDGKELGTAPLQDRVAIGSHVIELSLEGYRPFKEVVDVPAEGLPFLQPLEVDPDATPVTTTGDAGPGEDATATNDTGGDGGPTKDPAVDVAAAAGPTADELLADFDKLLADADFDAALDKIKEMVTHHPEDKRSGALFDRLAEARMKAPRSTTKKQPVRQGKRPLSDEQKKQEARDAYAAGEALYREGSYAESRAKFQSAIQLDPRYPQPHRAIARIYQRDNDVGRARYHLDRYLRLGGRDPDYRVRRWLEDNKGK